jgi:hypothetical protein
LRREMAVFIVTETWPSFDKFVKLGYCYVKLWILKRNNEKMLSLFS